MSLIHESVLVLNRYHLAVQVSEVKDAICALVAGKAKVIDDTYNLYTLNEWKKLTAEHPEHAEKYQGLLRSPSIQIFAPQVIIFPDCEYTSPLIRAVKYSRKNIFQRDGYTCQYCGKKFDKKELNIDHIVPRSRGGPNSWRNVVTSCIYCNAEKGDKLITELGWKLIAEPREPRWKSHVGKPFNQAKRKYWEAFLK